MANISKKILKDLDPVIIPEELKKSFVKIKESTTIREPFSIWFANIVHNHHPVNTRMF